MAMHREHELHSRRWGRNVGVALTLLAFIALVFGLTIAKVQNGDPLQGFDHTYRVEMDPDARVLPSMPSSVMSTGASTTGVSQ